MGDAAPQGRPAPPPPPPPGAASSAGRRPPWLIPAAVLVVAAVVLGGLWLWLLRTPLGVVAQAVVDTLEQGSATTRVTATAGGLPLVGELDLVVADGAVDFATGAARFERDLVGGVSTELRYTDAGTFIQVPLAADRWVALAADPTGAAPPASGGATPSSPLDITQVAPGLGNPIALLGLLRTLQAPPEVAGTEQLEVADGTEVVVTVYRAAIDLEAAAGTVTGEAADVVARLRQLTGQRRLPVDIGVDDDGLVRLVRFSATVPIAGLVEAQLETQLRFTDFGVAVDVEAPPPEQIVELDADRLRALDPLAALRDLLEAVPGL